MRKLCIILFVLVISKATFGQINICIRAGVNVATTKNIIAFPENRLGWYGGIVPNIPISKKFFFQPELLYSSKGDQSKSQSGSFNRSRRLNYLNLPLLLGYQFDKKTSIVIGPELGYLLAARLLIGDENNLNVIKEFPPRIDIGASLGLQYKIFKNIGIEIRYNYGFNTLYSVDAVGIRYTEKNGANRVFQIGTKISIL